MHLARELEGERGITVYYPYPNREGGYVFPDGERYIKLQEADMIEGRVVVLHSGQPDPNGGIVELEALLAILREHDVAPIEVFFTYFPYGMQDKSFSEGEIGVAESLVQKLIKYYKVEKVYALEPHFAEQKWVSRYPLVDVSTHELMIKEAKREHSKVMLVAADSSSKRRTGLPGLEKTRTDSYTVAHQDDAEFAKLVQGKVIGVIDDIVETGGTMVRFKEKCYDAGATGAIALITHGVLPEGINRLNSNYQELFLSNSINRPEANVDITPLILEAIKKG